MRLSKLTIMPKFKKALPSGIGPDRGMSAPPSTRTNMRLDGNKFQRCQSALSHYRKRPPAGGSKAQMDCDIRDIMVDVLRKPDGNKPGMMPAVIARRKSTQKVR